MQAGWPFFLQETIYTCQAKIVRIWLKKIIWSRKQSVTIILNQKILSLCQGFFAITGAA